MPATTTIRGRFAYILAALAIALLVLLAACGDDDDDDAGDDDAPTETSSSEDAGPDADIPEDEADDPTPTIPADVIDSEPTGAPETLSPEEEDFVVSLAQDAEAAVQVLDLYWATHWTEFFTGEYSSPIVYGGYVASDNPECGGIYSDGSSNAYYCPADDYVAWDWELFAANYLDEAIGDSFVWFVLAHEWGHAIQGRLDISLQSLAGELQADCLAAAALIGAEADGILLFEDGDRGEIFESLSAVADEAPWGDPEDHGSADERIEAYQLGENGGVEACLPTETA